MHGPGLTTHTRLDGRDEGRRTCGEGGGEGKVKGCKVEG